MRTARVFTPMLETSRRKRFLSRQRRTNSETDVSPPGNWQSRKFATGPAAYRVATDARTYAAVCVWDALGIVAALGANARVETRCPDCGDPLELEVHDGELTPTETIVHFLVPASRWYDDLAFT